MTPDRESALRRISSTWLGLTKSEVDELWAEIDQLRFENKAQAYQIDMGSKDLDVIRQLRDRLAVASDALEHAHEKHDYCGQVEDAITKLKQQDKEI